MGIRMSQNVGLSPTALDYIRNNCLHDTITVLRNGKWESEYKEPRKVLYKGKVDQYEPFAEPLLYEYETIDNYKVREIIQAQPWSSGPMYFLCLEDDTGKRMFEWTEEEIERCL